MRMRLDLKFEGVHRLRLAGSWGAISRAQLMESKISDEVEVLLFVRLPSQVRAEAWNG